MKRLHACLLLTGLLGHAVAVSAQTSPDADPELRAKLMQAVQNAESFEHRFDAEVWLVDMSSRLDRFVPDADERLDILRMLHAEAQRADLQPELVLAVIEVESAFDRFAISSAGAQGLMQVMPFWIKEIGVPDSNLFDMRTNLRFGCTILKHYLDREKGHLVNALARYNGSYGRPQYPYKVLDALHKRWYRG